MKIAYFGHPAHEWSKSDSFFLELLNDLGEVNVFRPSQLSVRDDLWSALFSDFDIYIFWQFDFLAYGFLAAGKKVVIVPMLDGSGGYSSKHWTLLKKAHFISFSKTLHRFLQIKRISSFHTQYAPAAETPQLSNDHSVYFWPREGGNNLNVETVDRWISTLGNNYQLVVRVNSEADFENNPNLYGLKDSHKIELIESRQQHIEAMNRAVAVVAPRSTEGIGMSFLEAMARGKAVIGLNRPTLNEYIIHGENGLLFNHSDSKSKKNYVLDSMGINAKNTIVDIRKSYLSSIPKLKEFLINVPDIYNKPKIEKALKLIELSVSVYGGNPIQNVPGINLETFMNISSLKNKSI